MLTKISRFVRGHKGILAFAAAALAGGGWVGYSTFGSNNGETRYVLAAVTRGTLTSSVSGSGQISASHQVDIKTKVSGDAILVGAANGQNVRAGALLVQIDSRDAQKAVRDAETNFQSAKIALEKIKKPADALAVIQAENALAQAETNLAKSYDDGSNATSNAFLDLPEIMTGLQNILYESTLNRGQDNISAYADSVKRYDENVLLFREDAAAAYRTARDAYDRTFLAWRAATRFSNRETAETLINETHDATKSVAEAVKNSADLLSFVKDRLTEHSQPIPSLLPMHQISLATYTGKTNTHLASLLGAKDGIRNGKNSAAEKTESLAKLKAGAEALDIQSQELAVRQRENALSDAAEKLADYSIRAPFDGAVGKLEAKKGDSISAGTLIATLITGQRIAEIALNEVDIAEIAPRQKATLIFDALPDLTLTGAVAEIDAIGTIAQGVVSYTIKVTFDTQDERIKPGMSVTATIITDTKPDVLLAPNSAIKSQGERHFVEVPAGEIPPRTRDAAGVALSQSPRRREVEIGATNDEFTEITDGLGEGDLVIARAIQPAGQQAAAQQNSPFRFPGGGGGRGGR